LSDRTECLTLLDFRWQLSQVRPYPVRGRTEVYVSPGVRLRKSRIEYTLIAFGLRLREDEVLGAEGPLYGRFDNGDSFQVRSLQIAHPQVTAYGEWAFTYERSPWRITSSRLNIRNAEKLGDLTKIKVALEQLLFEAKPVGRKPLPRDKNGSWRDLVKKAMDLKAKNPRLSWSIIAEAHLSISESTLRRYRHLFEAK
jgi:hypothetical protein